MIPVLFKEDEQIFTHNGIGALYESLSCDVIEEENGAFTMELEYPVDGEWFSELKDFRIIQAKPNDIDDPHNFRIYEIEKSIDELTVFVRANTRTNDLGNNLITNYVGRDVTPQQAMNGIKNKLAEPTNFDLISDIQTKSSVEWVRLNPLNAIVGARGSMVDIWGGEIKRTNTAIHLYSRRGRDGVATIRPGKNIEGLNMTVSTAGLVTKILPTYTYRPVDVPKYHMVTLKKDGTKEKRRVQNSGSTTLRDDITVLGNVVSSQYVNNYPMNYWLSVDYNDDEELRETVDTFIDGKLKHAEESPGIVDMSGFDRELENFVKTELDKRAKQYFTHRSPGVDKPTVRIKVNMLQLSDSPDWEEFKDLERIGLTDTLDVWVEKYDIDVEVRVTTLTYDSIAEQVRGFNAGSDRAPRQSVIEKKYDDLTKATNDYITSFKNGVQNIMRNTADGLNRKFEGYTEPPAELSSEGDIWFKEIGSGKVEIWIHDGVYWQPLMTEDFGKKLEADIEATQTELEEAKQQAKSDTEQALADAKTYADAEIVLIETQFDGIIEGVESDVAVAKQTADSALHKINNDISDRFDSLDIEVLAIETISNSAQVNAQTALNQSLDALGDASTALANAQTALNRANDVRDTADILSGQVSGFETTLAGFNQTVNNYTGQVSGFRNDILGLESTVVSYETELDEFGNTVSTYATEVSTLTNTVSGFQSTVSRIEQDYEDVSGTVATHTSQISNLDGQIALKANTTTVNALTGRVTTAETGITTNTNAIKLKASQSSVDTLTGRVTTAETNITSNADAIKLKASTSSVNTLTGRVSTAESSITANATAITQRLTSTQVNTLVDGKGFAKETSVSTRFNDIQSTVDGTTQTIATLRTDVNGKATITQFNTLNSTVNGTVTRVGNAEGKITTIESNVSGLQTTVASKAAQSQVTQLATGLSSVVKDLGDLEIGGRNHLRNTEVGNSEPISMFGHPMAGPSFSFSTGTEYYTLESRVSSGEAYYRAIIHGTVPSELSGTWTFSGEVLIPEGTSGTLATRTQIAITSPSGWVDSYGNGERPINATKGIWTKFIHTFEMPKGTQSLHLGIRFDIGTQVAGDKIHFKNFKLEKGNKATDWTPAPEDTQSQISQLSDNINLRVAKGDVINQINVSTEGILIDGKRTHITGTTTIDNGVIKNAHIGDINATKITAGTISAARLNAPAIVTAGLTANVIKSTHISADTALFDKLFSTSSATDRLSARTAWITDANIVNASISGVKIADATITSAKISALDVSKLNGNTTEFVLSAWNAGLDNVTIDASGIYMTGSGAWRRTYLSATGFDLYNGVGGGNKAGTIGYFKEHANSATAKENYMRTTEGGHHYIGIGVNRNHSFAIGYNEYTDTLNGYGRALVVSGISGDISLLRETKMGNGVRLWFSGGSYIGEPPNSQHFDINAKGPIRLYNSINSLKAIISANFNLYSDLNMQNNNIYNNSDVRLKKNITPTGLKSLDLIKQWNFVDYEWRDERLKGTFMGVIAQDTPEIASYNEETGFYAINSSKQLMMTTHAVQQLAIMEENTNKVASQALQLGESNKSEIDELREENRDLRNRIEELESVV